jgi:hypothetical protein
MQIGFIFLWIGPVAPTSEHDNEPWDEEFFD